MKFIDNELIWESYLDSQSINSKKGVNLDPQFDQEDNEVVMEIEPMGAVEVDHDHSFEDEGDYVEEHLDHEEKEEHEMSELVLSDIKKLAKYSQKLLQHCQHTELEPWMMAKLVKASIYVCDVYDQLDDLDGGIDFANDASSDTYI